MIIRSLCFDVFDAKTGIHRARANPGAMTGRAKKNATNALPLTDSYWLAVRLINDRTTLAEFAEQVETDDRLRASERASLRSALMARIRP